MECSKSFTIEVTDSAPCCFALDSSPAVGVQPGSSCYAVDDDRVVVGRNPNDIVFINATTDLVAGSIAGVGTFVTFLIYSPVNNRVYSHDLATADILEINPNLMTHSNTIAPPAGVTALREPCYDATSDLIYYPGSTATDIVIMRFNPQTLTPDVLVTLPNPGIGFHNFGRRAAHATSNNRIFIPYFLDDGLGTTQAYFLVYSVAGALLSTVAVPGATGSSGEELCYWDETNQVIYYLSDRAVGGNPGLLVINPADNSTIDSATVSNNLGCASMSPNCQSLNVLCADGNLNQFDTSDYSSICTTAVVAGIVSGSQICSSPTKVYVPDNVAGVVRVMAPP